MLERRFDVLIFDWDGTLYDSIDWIVDCLQQAAIESGLPTPPPAAAKSVIGLGLGEALQTLFPDTAESRVERLMDAYRRRYFSKTIRPEDLFDGVAAMLEQLRTEGFRLAIATGKARRGLDRALAGTGVRHLFDVTRCADETASKPNPAMIEQIIASLSVSRQRTVMIGDTTHDLAMANRAGIAAIAVASGAHTRQELVALRPMACLADLRELPRVI